MTRPQLDAATSGERWAARGGWIRTALLAVLFPLSCFALVEAGTRQFFNVPRWLIPSVAACTRRDTLLGYSFTPRCVGRMSATAVRTNSLGLRGDDVPENGDRRILALGDSCTWGFGVAERESYPAVLQRLLDEGDRRVRYRVINAGAPGYTSHHGLLYLRERGLQLHPAYVLIAFEWNDGMPIGDAVKKLERVQRFRLVLQLDDWLHEHSDFYRLLASRLGSEALPNLELQVVPPKFRENMVAMIELAREHGAQPMLIDWNARPVYADVLDEVSVALAVPLVRYYGPRIPGDVVHPSAEGYRRLASVLYARLRDAGYVGGS